MYQHPDSSKLTTETFTGIRPIPLDSSHHTNKRDRRDRRARRDRRDRRDRREDRRDRLTARTLEITLQGLLIVVVAVGIGLFLTRCSL